MTLQPMATTPTALEEPVAEGWRADREADEGGGVIAGAVGRGWG
jgi:hypothetical protein